MDTRQSGLARYAADLPPVDRFVTLGEGGTPLLPLPGLTGQLGLAGLSVKLESLNPTGSYKDRVAAMSLTLARQRGHSGWIATSSGNAGVAFAAYGSRAGLPGFLCLVAGAPMSKRAALAPYRVAVRAIEGVGAGGTGAAGTDLMAAVRSAAEAHDLYLGITAHAYNPDGMRGIDTIGYELADQAPAATHVYVPTGGGGLLAALARGLAHRGHPAAVVACQPAGCAPIAGYLAGTLPAPRQDQCDSEISALQLPAPPDGALAAAAASGSGGWGCAVSDAEILAAQQELARVEGVAVEPAAAAALAGVRADIAAGRLGPADHPVLVATGAGWKDLGRFAAAAEAFPTGPLAGLPDQVAGWLATLDREGVEA